MNFTETMNHESTVDGEVFYTTFKWSLNHWTLFYDYYQKTIQSPEFDVVGTENCKCSLTMSIDGRDQKGYAGSTVVSVVFSGKSSFSFQRGRISFVDKKMNKLSQIRCVTMNLLQTRINLDFVLDRSCPYLDDDTLTLFFELYSMKNIRNMPIETSVLSSIFNNHAQEKFLQFCNTEEFNDVTFMVDETPLTANKLILALQSNIFEAMFKSQTKEQIEGVVQIDNVDAETFKTFLTYMNTGKVENIGEVVTKLVFVADKYKVLSLSNICTNYMGAHLTVENAVDYLITGNQLGCSTLVEQVIKFITCNRNALADPVHYNLLSKYPDLISRVFAQ